MKAYKIILEQYEYTTNKISKIKADNGQLVERAETDDNGDPIYIQKPMNIKFQLPLILCNANLDTKDKPEFDLMEIGPIAQKIEQCKEIALVVSKQELEILKKRLKVVSKHYGYSFYEMFARINDAIEVEVEEAKK